MEEKRFAIRKKAVKEIIQVLADNDLTAQECRVVLKDTKFVLKQRPLCKSFPDEMDDVLNKNVHEFKDFDEYNSINTL